MAVLGAIFLVALAPKIDTDLWWHLLDGRYIAVHHAILRHDIYSATFYGHSWVDHEWLSELLLYGLYSLAGLWGTIVGFAVVIAATYALVYKQMLERGIRPLLGLAVLTLAFVASSITWGARPQMLTLLFLAAYSYLLWRYQRNPNPRLLLWFPGLMLLWANLDGGWVLGLVLLAPALAGEWLNRVTRAPEALSAVQLRWLGLALIATIVATLVNPDGLGEVLYPLVWVFPNAYANVLNEWVSPDFHQLQFMVFEGMLLLLLGGLMIGRRRPNWDQLLIVIAFTYLALAESRNVAVWTVVVTPLLAVFLQQAGTTLRQMLPERRYGRREVAGRWARAINLILLVMVLIVYLAEGVHYVNGKALASAQRNNFPEGAAQYLATHRLPSRVFNAYAWGGYLLWKDSPHYRDFIDGRANTLFDTRILNAYLTVSSAAPGWQDAVRQYNVQVIMMETGSAIDSVLALNHQWREAYHDNVTTIYVRQPGPGTAARGASR